MSQERRPSFATYLLPSLSSSFRHRQSSSTSTLSDNLPTLSFSTRSSISITPGSSPPSSYTARERYIFTPPQHGLLHEALSQNPPAAEPETRLQRAHPNTLRCVTCATDIAFASQIVSKGFTGRHGRAYLVSLPSSTESTCRGDLTDRRGLLINTKIGRNVNRELLTGLHVVADVSCMICNSVLGWKYVDAKELSQRYKIGKFILEMKRVVQVAGWENGILGEQEGNESGHETIREEEEEEEEDVVVFDEDDDDECDELFAGVWNAETVAKRRAKVAARK